MREEAGRVTHYFTNINVGIVKLSSELRVGDQISIEGATTDFEQQVESMQIDREDIENAGPNDEIGIKLKERAREGDKVYKI